MESSRRWRGREEGRRAVIPKIIEKPQENINLCLLKIQRKREITFFIHKTWRAQFGTDLEASSLRTSSHNTQKCFAKCQQRKTINSHPKL